MEYAQDQILYWLKSEQTSGKLLRRHFRFFQPNPFKGSSRQVVITFFFWEMTDTIVKWDESR